MLTDRQTTQPAFDTGMEEVARLIGLPPGAKAFKLAVADFLSDAQRPNRRFRYALAGG